MYILLFHSLINFCGILLLQPLWSHIPTAHDLISNWQEMQSRKAVESREMLWRMCVQRPGEHLRNSPVQACPTGDDCGMAACDLQQGHCLGDSLQPRPGLLRPRAPQLQLPWWHFSNAGNFTAVPQFQHAGLFCLHSASTPLPPSVALWQPSPRHHPSPGAWLSQPDPHLSTCCLPKPHVLKPQLK